MIYLNTVLKRVLVLSGLFFWSGLLTAQPGQPGSTLDHLDVIHYQIHIDSINTALESIEGRAMLSITTKQDNTGTIELELIELQLDTVYSDWGPVTYSQTDTTIEVTLDNPINIGDTILLTVYYHGQPYYDDWGGFHFDGEYAFNLGVGLYKIPHNLGKSWFPCIDNFTDRAYYDIYTTLDTAKTAVCGGVLVETIPHGNGTATWHWRYAHSLPTYLVSVATGNYVAVRDTFQGEEADIPIDIYVRPQDTSKVAGTFVHLKEVLEQFERDMGPYLWERIGYVSTGQGAMEHASNIALRHSAISGNTAYESTIMHELTHMWLGDQVTCCSAEEMWLNEGWATFFAMYYTIELYGGDMFKESMRDTHAEVLKLAHTPGREGAYFPLNNIPQEFTYGVTAYDRGSTVVQALRFYLGDSLFFEALKSYISAFAYNSACSEDMMNHFSAFTGIDMSGFFNNWVFNPGTPHYAVSSFSSVTSGDQFEVTVNVRQKRKGYDFTGDLNIMEVTFMDEDWNSHTDTIHFSGESGSSQKTLDFKPTAVFTDLEEQMCDATIDNYKILGETGDYTFDDTYCILTLEDISDSSFIQVIHNWAAPDSLAEPVSGLRLSDYRHWTINGILPETFEASAKFAYSNQSHLDDSLILQESDSVIMMYRPDATEEWQEVITERIGHWYVGYLKVTDLKMGDYTMAVRETQVSTPETMEGKKNLLTVFPNPTSDTFRINIDTWISNHLGIYDISGKMIKEYIVEPGLTSIDWAPGKLPAGAYFIILKSEWDEILARERVIYSK